MSALKVQVITPGGSPFADCLVCVRPQGGDSLRCQTDKAGVANFVVPKGLVEVSANHFGYVQIAAVTWKAIGDGWVTVELSPAA